MRTEFDKAEVDAVCKVLSRSIGQLEVTQDMMTYTESAAHLIEDLYDVMEHVFDVRLNREEATTDDK